MAVTRPRGIWQHFTAPCDAGHSAAMHHHHAEHAVPLFQAPVSVSATLQTVTGLCRCVRYSMSPARTDVTLEHCSHILRCICTDVGRHAYAHVRVASTMELPVRRALACPSGHACPHASLYHHAHQAWYNP